MDDQTPASKTQAPCTCQQLSGQLGVLLPRVELHVLIECQLLQFRSDMSYQFEWESSKSQQDTVQLDSIIDLAQCIQRGQQTLGLIEAGLPAKKAKHTVAAHIWVRIRFQFRARPRGLVRPV